MTLIKWNQDYSVNIDKFDSQHQKLIEIINILYDAMSHGKGKEVLGEALSGLIDYTKYHFSSEEELMKQYGYPDMKSHIAEHKNLADKAIKYHNEFKSGNKALSMDILLFLKDWLINHIMGIDKKYSDFFAEKGVS